MHLIAAIVSAVILIGTASGALALANSSGSSSGAEVPPGQLNRKGVSGIVSAVGGGSLDVATRHGIVTVNVDGGTSITGQGNTPLSLSDIAVDDRVSIQLNRAPSEPDDSSESEGGDSGSSTSTDDGSGGDGGSFTSTDDGSGGGDGSSTSTHDGSGGGDGSSTSTDDGSGGGDGSSTSTDDGSGGDDGSSTSTDSGTSTSTDSGSSTSTDSTATSTLETEEEALTKVKSRLKFENLTNIRTVTAVRIKVIQNKVKTKHVRAVVTGKGGGKFQLICGTGDTSTSSSTDSTGDGSTDTSGTSTDGTLDEQDVDGIDDVDAEVGEEIILIADSDEETGDGGCPTKVKGGQNSKSIDDRLAALAEKTAGRDAKLAERLAEKADRGKQDREDRTDKTSGNANSETKGKVDTTRGKDKSDDDTKGGKPDDDTKGGKPKK